MSQWGGINENLSPSSPNQPFTPKEANNQEERSAQQQLGCLKQQLSQRGPGFQPREMELEAAQEELRQLQAQELKEAEVKEEVAALAPHVAFFTADCSQRSAPFGDADRSATAVLRPKNSIVFVHRMLPPIALDLKFSKNRLPRTGRKPNGTSGAINAIICNEKNNRQTKNRKNWSKKERVQQRKEGMKKRKKGRKIRK